MKQHIIKVLKIIILIQLTLHCTSCGSQYAVHKYENIQHRDSIDLVVKDVTVNEYVIFHGVTVIPEGVTLTIEKGNEISFSDGSELIVKGSLQAISTKENPIKIKNISLENWKGISFIGVDSSQLGADSLNSDNSSTLHNVIIQCDEDSLINHCYTQLDTCNITMKKTNHKVVNELAKFGIYCLWLLPILVIKGMEANAIGSAMSF